MKFPALLVAGKFKKNMTQVKQKIKMPLRQRIMISDIFFEIRFERVWSLIDVF